MKSWIPTVTAVALWSGASACSCNPELPDDPPDTTTEDTSRPPPPDTQDTGPEPDCAVPEIEPNNTDAEATLLPKETLGCGTIDAPLDIDNFVTEVDEEGWLSITTAARSIGSIADIQLFLNPPEGSATFRQDDEGTTDASLLFPGTVGTWRIQVSEQQFSGGEDFFYWVSVSTAKAPVEWDRGEVEPNDGLPDAMLVADGDSVFGDMDESGDGDWYRIDVPDIDLDGDGNPDKHTITVSVDGYTYGSAGDFSLWRTDAAGVLQPPGCDDNIDDGVPIDEVACEIRAPAIDPAVHDPVMEFDSVGGETVYIKLDEQMFHSGPHTWYVIRFSVEGP